MKRHTITANLSSPWTIDQDGCMTAPVVMMTEGVRCGSAGCLLYQTEVIRQSAESFNGTPVCFDHPQDERGFVSIQSCPDKAVGEIRNARYEKGALRGHVRIAKKCSEIRQQAQMIREVSIGVFTEEEPTVGSYGDKSFQAIVRNMRPDHVALLTREAGACSWEDGCGIRNNVHQTRRIEMADQILTPAGVVINEGDEERSQAQKDLAEWQYCPDAGLPHTGVIQDLQRKAKQDQQKARQVGQGAGSPSDEPEPMPPAGVRFQD